MNEIIRSIEEAQLRKDLPKFNIGDTVKVQVLEIDPKTGKISLDRLDKPDAPEGSAPAPREHRGHDRHEGGKREGGQRDVRPGRANRTPRRRHESQ